MSKKLFFLVGFLILVLVAPASAFPPSPPTPAGSSTTDTSAFDGNLSATEDTVQKALDALDDVVGVGDTTETNQDDAWKAVSDGTGTETFIAVTYQDATNDVDFVVPVLDEDDLASDSATDLATQQSIKAYVDASGSQRTQEEIEDFVGAMTTGNTETYITVTYQDADGTIDFVVDQAAIIAAVTWGGDLSSSGTTPQVVEGNVDHDSLANFVANEHLDWTVDLGATNIHVNNIDLSAVYEPIGITESDISDLGTTVYLKTALDSSAEIVAVAGWAANIASILDAADYAAVKTLLDTDDIQTLTGIAAGTAHLGTFTGTTISDSTTIKAGMQELETFIEGLGGGHDPVTIAAGITGLTLSTQELSLHAYIEDLAEFTDPNADHILFWDDTAGVFTGLVPATNVITISGTSLTLADHATARTALGLAIGSDVQAYSGVLDTYAGIDPSADVQSVLGAADEAAIRTFLDLEAGTDFYDIAGADAAFEAVDAEIVRADTADNIGAVWEWQDGIAANFGNDADFSILYDETTDDRLEIEASNAAADTETYFYNSDGTYKQNVRVEGDVIADSFQASGAGESYLELGNNGSSPTLSLANGIYVVNNAIKFYENSVEIDPITSADSPAWTGQHDFSTAAASLTLPSTAADSSGEISMSAGNQLKWHDGAKVITIDTTPTTDNYVLKYDNATATFTLEADETGGTPSWDTVTDPAGDQTLTHGATEQTIFEFTGAFGAGAQFQVAQNTGNPTAGTLFEVEGDDDNIVIAQFGDTGGTNYWRIAEVSANNYQLLNAGAATFNLAAATDLLVAGSQIALDDLATGVPALAADSVDTITEIAAALKSGADGTLITGTAGTDTYTAVWNADGDLVDGFDPAIVAAITATASEINTPLDGATTTLAEFQQLQTIGATTISANQWAALGGIAETLAAAELDILDGVSGVTAAELSYIGDVTGLIQAQIDLKAPLASPIFTTAMTIPYTTSGDQAVTVGMLGLKTDEDMLITHGGANGEVQDEAGISLLEHVVLVVDPAWYYDQESTYRTLPIMTLIDDAPHGITITEWRVDYVGGDPTTELDADIMCDTTPDYNPAAGATVMDVIDTTAGTSTADTGFDSATCANASKLYLRFGADPADANVVIAVELWYFINED